MWIWIQAKFTDEDETTVPNSKLYSTNKEWIKTTNFCEFTTVFAKKCFSRLRTRMYPTNSTNSSKKSSWWNDCSKMWIWESWGTKISEARTGLDFRKCQVSKIRTKYLTNLQWTSDYFFSRRSKTYGSNVYFVLETAHWSPNFPQLCRSGPHVQLHLYRR